jgi:hypothetical protein
MPTYGNTYRLWPRNARERFYKSNGARSRLLDQRHPDQRLAARRIGSPIPPNLRFGPFNTGGGDGGGKGGGAEEDEGDEA